MKTPARLLALTAAIALPCAAFGQPLVKNAATSIYAVVADPTRIAFAPDGTLFVGRDASGSGGGSGDAVKIHRVAPGGSPVTEFGNLAISDPDALIVDAVGAVSGTPGAVLVGGVHPGGTTGKIVRIAPDGTVTTLFGPDASILNPSHFIFDSAGRLLFTENNNGKVMVTTGGAPTNLFSLAGAMFIVEDAVGRLVASSSSDTTLRLYSSNGALLNSNFASAKTASPLARGPGGIWGTDLYAVAANGDLIRVDLQGVATNRVGTGFGNVSDLQFGPDGALYASEFSADRIYRVAQPAVPGAQTTVYARVTDPVRLSFAPDGTLFVGRDNTGSGGDFDDAVKIHRIGSGGSPAEEYGNAAITDPDAVFYDATGQFSGTPGAVLVAGTQLNNLLGKIVKILPDGTIATNYGPTAFNFNPNLFVLDEAGGRLLLSDDVGGKVWAMTNSTPVPLFNLPQAFPLAVDALGRILAGANDARLRLYSSAGELLNSTFVPAQTNTILARAPGGFWGTDVYFIGTNWNLMRVDTNGVVSQSGTGFGGLNGFAFGPDGAFYASQLNSDLIWRIAPDAPRLRIQRDVAAVVVSWPQPAPGWNLEFTPHLVTASTNTWTLILPPYPTNTADYFVTESAPVGSRFYRLRKP